MWIRYMCYIYTCIHVYVYIYMRSIFGFTVSCRWEKFRQLISRRAPSRSKLLQPETATSNGVWKWWVNHHEMLKLRIEWWFHGDFMVVSWGLNGDWMGIEWGLNGIYWGFNGILLGIYGDRYRTHARACLKMGYPPRNGHRIHREKRWSIKAWNMVSRCSGTGEQSQAFAGGWLELSL